jgi:hypothetical protein
MKTGAKEVEREALATYDQYKTFERQHYGHECRQNPQMVFRQR